MAPEHYGWLFGLNIAGLMGMSFLNRKLVVRFGLDTLLRVATVTAAVAMLGGLLLSELGVGGLWGIVVPVFVFFAMNGIIASTATAAALDGVPRELAGSATALIGSLQYGSGILPTALLAVVADGTPRPFVLVMAVFGVAAALVAARGGSSGNR